MKDNFFKRTVIFAAALLLLSSSAVAAHAWNSADEIARLKKEVPSLETFGENSAVIWLRNNESRMLADGSMENLRATIIMMGERVPADWKTLRYPVPADGSLSIEEAAWYNTMTGMKEGSLPVNEEKLAGGAAVKVISVPDDTVGRAVVITVKENRANRYGVDETVNMAGSLPIWEQNVSVELPEGMELFWIGRDMKDPVVARQNNVQRYSWQVMNQLPWHGEGFVVNERPMLSFSSKKGVTHSLRMLNDIARSMPAPSVPVSMKGDAARAGAKLIEWVTAPERTLRDYPENWVRAADRIPPEGPWTPWEQTLLLNKWLASQGWTVSLWWEAKMPLNASTPASTTLFAYPILELRPREGAKPSYFKAGLPFAFDRLPSSIAGSEIYGLKDDEYVTKKLPSGSSSENRLALLWRLKLDDQGRAAGTLDVTVTGGWSDLFSGNEVPSLNKIGPLLLAKINFAIPGMNITPTSVEPFSAGYKLSFDVRCVPGIIHGGSMLLRLPGGIPLLVSEMIGREKKYTLRFPFIIDQKVRMSMPGGFKMLQTPPLKQLGSGTKAILKESITHWPKKAELLADSTWVVKNREIDGVLAQLLREELNASLRWPVLDLPFRK
ncbi:hypothetical protein [Cloacibacillus evryensis]|uniref:hypothetical protein n=1 Tax=Cloacibacillus evryensis TaxID=508460 RepID=UPI00241E75A4|nr:hypothetical protein [Cloacibacillus evryensis]